MLEWLFAREPEWVELGSIEKEKGWSKVEAKASEIDHKLRLIRPTLELQTRFWQPVNAGSD